MKTVYGIKPFYDNENDEEEKEFITVLSSIFYFGKKFQLGYFTPIDLQKTDDLFVFIIYKMVYPDMKLFERSILSENKTEIIDLIKILTEKLVWCNENVTKIKTTIHFEPIELEVNDNLKIENTVEHWLDYLKDITEEKMKEDYKKGLENGYFQQKVL